MVVFSSPSHDSAGPFPNGKITLRFDRPMDRESVREALKVTPGVPFEVDWNEAGSEVAIRCEPPREAEIFKVRLEADARDVEGRSLHAPFETRFRPLAK
jgi:hypothetical protein